MAPIVKSAKHLKGMIVPVFTPFQKTDGGGGDTFHNLYKYRCKVVNALADQNCR